MAKELTEKRAKEWGDVDESLVFMLDQKIPKDHKILEIGCNLGSLSHGLYTHGYTNLVATDLLPDRIEEGKKRYPEIKDSLQVAAGERLPFPDNSFDVVCSFDLVEHIPETDAHFAEVRRVLKPGGKYIFQTPNKITNIPWSIIKDRHLTKWREYHCALHTYGALKRRIKKNGFSISKFEKRDLLTEFKLQKIKAKLGIVGVWIITLTNHLPLPFTPNFWVVISPDN